MINLPKLTEKDLEIFKGKKIIICGYKGYSVSIFKLFKYLNLDVLAVYDESVKDSIKTKIMGITFINLNDFHKYSKHSNILIQPSDDNPDFINKTRELSADMQLAISPYTYGEMMFSFNSLRLFKMYKKSLFREYKLFRFKSTVNKFKNHEMKKALEKHESLFVVCSPPKTADHTLNYTFDDFNNKIEHKIKYINIFHRPICLSQKVLNNKTTKIITSIRDPISQNLSMCFHMIGSAIFDDNLILGEIINKNHHMKKQIINKYDELSRNHSDDMQILWNMFLSRYVYDEDVIKPAYIYYSIQQFEKDFSKHILDITKYPFNKEKGYTIIKEGNIEVFVYQLEKLNKLVPELSEWVGSPFTELVRGNDSSNKWIADSYKQAQKEIEITQEYFDRCYNEPYVQHCYSQADIEKFKERWRPHIK